MRRYDITCMLCLSCALIVLHVNSQSNCPAGWFGLQCKYRCRCVDDKCEKNGQCLNPYMCLGGWFGPECQFIDMAYKMQNHTVLTDGNDSTCASPPASDTVTITVNDTIYTWLRVRVRSPVAFEDLSVTFFMNSAEVKCSFPKKLVVDNTAMDYHCYIQNQFINQVTLKGAAVSSLCSVNVDGGRNIALKETTKQDSVFSEVIGNVLFNYTSDLAVDGDVRNSLTQYKTCARTSGTSTWSLFFAQTHYVYRYIIYNRGDASPERLKGFILESFDSKNKSAFVHQDQIPDAQAIYKITPDRILPLNWLTVRVSNNQPQLTLCEVEVYGDSLCDGGYYGRDCEMECQCLGKARCIESTGLCPNGCPVGYIGPGCQTECSPGQFGKDCSQRCSSNCEDDDNSTIPLCNSVTGACLVGCKPGFTGEFCENGCVVGTFGKNCSQTCSLTCEQPDNSSMSSCNPTNGDCLMRCKPGYSGAFCDTECVGKFGQDCNKTCSLTCEQPDNSSISSCNHTTGECLMGCKPGYTGEFCDTNCVAGAFGKDCKSKCSENCQASDDAKNAVCDPMTGACLKGCKDGSSGDLCENASISVCAAGTFGKDCKFNCSKNCQAPGNAGIAECDPTTGACLKGCKDGSSGERCESVAPERSSGDSNIELIVALCAVFATAFTVGYCLRKKKRARPSDEATVRGAGG